MFETFLWLVQSSFRWKPTQSHRSSRLGLVFGEVGPCPGRNIFSVVNICIELSLYAVALDFWTSDFSYFKNVSKFIILIRLWEDSNQGPVIISQATKPLYYRGMSWQNLAFDSR